MVVFAQALQVVFIPFSLQPQDLCTGCGLLGSLVSPPLASSTLTHPSDLSPLSQGSPPWPLNPKQVKLSSDATHLTFGVGVGGVCVCVVFPSSYFPVFLGD